MKLRCETKMRKQLQVKLFVPILIDELLSTDDGTKLAFIGITCIPDPFNFPLVQIHLRLSIRGFTAKLIYPRNNKFVAVPECF